jgi:predicted esterase
VTIDAGRAGDRAKPAGSAVRQPRTGALAGVLLHGRGGTPDEMVGLAERLGLERRRWLAPAAPGGSWYPHRFMGPIDINEPFLSHAIDDCDRAVEEASEHGSVRVAIVGFSQGACLAAEYALRRPGRCAALVMFTGGLIGPPGTAWRLASPATSLGGLPVLVTGSEIDEWVPAARVRETADVLKTLGADVRCRIYTDRPHIVGDEEIVEARKLLEHVSNT